MSEHLSVNEFATPVVLWLGEPSCGDPKVVGGKSAQLSRLADLHPVPDAFCVTTAAYAAFRHGDAMPGGVAEAVLQAYEELSARHVRGSARVPPGLPVAVRSSAVGEDGVSASFAGQHATHLNVRGAEGLLVAVEGVWRSARSDGALAYRRAQGLAEAPVSVAVLVQRLVDCDVSGVVFSMDPVAMDSGRVVISASWGLGESLMGGGINPDRWVLDKGSLEVLGETLGGKELMTIADVAGTREVSTPRYLRQRPSLREEEVREVARLALRLEAMLGRPVDVEFAIEGGQPILLQCRPVTGMGTDAPMGAGR